LDFFGRCVGAHGGKSNKDPTGRKSKKKAKGGKGDCASGKLDFFGRCVGAHGGKSNKDPTGRKSKRKRGRSHV